MVRITLEKGESIEHAMRRFKRKCKRDGIQNDFKKYRYYLKPSKRKRLAKKLSIKRAKKSSF